MHYGLSLFAAYLSILALLPCSDALPVIPEAAPARVHAQNSEHEHDEDHEDHCTLFCVCSCCSAFLDVPPTLVTFDLEDPLSPTGKTEPRFTPRWKVEEITTDNWQPPRA